MKSIKIKRIISSIAFAILLLLAIAKCADVLEHKEARKKYTPFYESKTNFDVIFLGTSHMWNHVMPMELWRDYGISSYNWGYANCTPAENYYLIQDIVKYTSPKVVVIDVFGITEYESYENGKYRTDTIGQQHVQFDSLPIWSKSKADASKDVFDNYAHNEDFIWNFIMYHNRWTELSQSDFEYEITTEKGAHFLTGLGTSSFTPVGDDEKTTVNSVCYPYLLKIIEYCQKQGIQVLCAYLPYGSCSDAVQVIANSVGDTLEQYPNCRYVNLLKKNILDFNTDVYPDNEHLNYSGASKLTSWFGQYLTVNYCLDDYSENQSWEQDYRDYEAYKEATIKSQQSLVAYLVQLKDEDFTADIEIYNPDLMNSERLSSLLNNARMVPRYVEKETDVCSHLVITNSITGNVVEEVDFIIPNPDSFDIFAINKVVD